MQGGIMLNLLNVLLKILICSFFIVCKAYSVEGMTPMQPGGTTGMHLGVPPPDGIYFTVNYDHEAGNLKNGSGKNAKIANGRTRFSNHTILTNLTWVPGWYFLGAKYNFTLLQPYKFLKTTNSGSVGENHTNGLINTGVAPINLSWDMGGGFFIGAGLMIYLPTGEYHYQENHYSGLQEVSSDNLGWDYWTVEPNIAFTYLYDEWAFTINNTFDFNTKNTTTEYQSGHLYYLDMTISKKITNSLTIGLIGNYTKQFTDDEINGVKASAVDGIFSSGRRVEQRLLGPMFKYHFNDFMLTGRFLFNLHAENDAGIDLFHIGVTVPLGK